MIKNAESSLIQSEYHNSILYCYSGESLTAVRRPESTFMLLQYGDQLIAALTHESNG